MSKKSATNQDSMRFFLLSCLGDPDDESLCFLDNFIDGIEPLSWTVARGALLKKDWPTEAKLFMNKENPGKKLLSLLGTTNNIIIGSTLLKEAIEKHCQDIEVEYLPFTLYDHRKKVYSRDYFIINPIGTFDCLNYDESVIKWDEEEPGKIISIKKYVLDRQKMKNAPSFFRIDRDPTAYVLDLAIAREFKKHNFSNIFWAELPLNTK